jgi:hypothetical protein
MNVWMVALVHGTILMSEGPLRQTLPQCQSDITTHREALIGELSAAYSVDGGKLQLKCVESASDPNRKPLTIPPFVTPWDKTAK